MKQLRERSFSTDSLTVIFLFLFSALICGVSGSCNSPYVPKQTGYFKIHFPEKKYQVFNEPGYPYTFEYPVYAQITKDTTFFDTIPENPWWINIEFPGFQGNIYVSYKTIGKKYTLQRLIDDAFNMTNEHTVMATAIDDSLMVTPYQVHGMFFKLGGEVATANQFFLTDSVRHFLRGALYFNATPNEDSLRPVNDFLVADMKHLINTFRWKDSSRFERRVP